jgi:hypothetical protein
MTGPISCQAFNLLFVEVENVSGKTGQEHKWSGLNNGLFQSDVFFYPAVESPQLPLEAFSQSRDVTLFSASQDNSTYTSNL